MSGTVAPIPVMTLLDSNGNPLVGGKLYSYAAGTSSPIATYDSSTLATPNANPVIADAAGRVEIWLSPGVSYKFQCDNSLDVTQWTVDNVESVPSANVALDIVGTVGESVSMNDFLYLSAGDGGKTAGYWYKTDPANTYSSSSAGVAGFAPAAISSGEEGSIRLQGRITSLSGLAAGSVYYASATPGLLTVSAPANALIAGVADSSTSLVVQPSANVTAGIDARLTIAETDITALEGAIGGVNLLKDSAFLIWAAGDALAPTHWVMSGAGAAIARETGTIKIGAMCAKLTAGGGATAYLLQQLLTSTTYDGNWLDAKTVSLGAWVWCASASKAALYINDGATTSSSSNHTGASAWEWLTVTHTIDASATLLSGGLSVGTSTAAYISGPTMLLGSTAPLQYQPSPCVYGTIRFTYAGTVATATQWDTWVPARPAIIKQTQLYAKTAPTGASLIVDVNTWDGAAYTTAYTTKPTIAAAANSGGAVPDGTYARRCLSTYVATTAYPTSAGQMMTVDIDQVGSSVAGANLGIHVRVLQFTSPLEQFLGVTEIS